MYSLSQAFPYAAKLHADFPQCTGSNPNRNWLFFGTMAVLMAIQRPIEVTFKNLFSKVLQEDKFPLGSDLRRDKAQMLGERIFKLTVTLGYTVALYWILWDSPYLDVRLGGSIERPLYFWEHPCQRLPAHLDTFYLVKLGYHCYELAHTALMDRRRADFLEYLLHHLLTFALILFSYGLSYLPVGAAVMLLHDLSDVFVCLFKLLIDVTPIVIQMSSYALMVLSWVYIRLWFFPVHVIGRIFEEVNDWHGSPINMTFAYMLPGFLTALFGLHLLWFYVMLKGLAKRLSKKDWTKQISLAGSENRGS